MKDSRRLTKINPSEQLAQKHLEKSKYNYQVLLSLEKLNYHDWELNVGFYSIYHCFLAILSKFGYESRNQSCTISVILKLIEEKKIDLNPDLILQFDTLDTESGITNPTIRLNREQSTYGVETSIDLKQLENIKKLAITIQKETIKILSK
jgi:uncharacterized protein (UPF0332 family)